MNEPRSVEHELHLLEALNRTPETTQANLAAQVGVAVGTVNWYLKRWSKKGYVKASRIGRWQWRYLLTPQGMARKATLASEYVDASMRLYRRTRAEAKRLLGEAQRAGHSAVHIDGSGEIADICRLTCLELGLSAVESPAVPRLHLDGATLSLHLPHEPASAALGSGEEIDDQQGATAE